MKCQVPLSMLSRLPLTFVPAFLTIRPLVFEFHSQVYRFDRTRARERPAAFDA
jgi:hypothetical protein